MLSNQRFFKTTIVIATLFTCIFSLTKCIQKKEEEKSVSETQQEIRFAGSAACANCHKEIYATHIHTPHYLTSRPALEKYIKGSFVPGQNIFRYDSDMVVVMEKRDSGFYQVGYFKGQEKIARRFDIAVGSGAKGQTYLYRSGSYLVQLPVSYLTAAGKWANSPQYPTHPVLFNRPITSRCMECHTTYIKKISPAKDVLDKFDQNSIIYGIDCEKCHGPAAKHVEFQTQHPTDTTAKYIVNPGRFTRQQSLDLCALCHSGPIHKTKPSFSFTAGEKLSDYFQIDTTLVNPDSIDVHGNQLGLLRSSKCFRMSATMTCVTCHNPHQNERENLVVLSQRCMGCHNSTHAPICKMIASIGASIQSNCVDCHMPKMKSKFVTELLPEEKVPTAALIRSHFIKIYPDETKKFKSAHGTK